MVVSPISCNTPQPQPPSLAPQGPLCLGKTELDTDTPSLAAFRLGWRDPGVHLGRLPGGGESQPGFNGYVGAPQAELVEGTARPREQCE